MIMLSVFVLCSCKKDSKDETPQQDDRLQKVTDSMRALNNYIRSLMKGGNILEPSTVEIMQHSIKCTYKVSHLASKQRTYIIPVTGSGQEMTEHETG